MIWIGRPVSSSCAARVSDWNDYPCPGTSVRHWHTTCATSAPRARAGASSSAPQCPGFFLSKQGTRITQWSVRWTFVKLSHQIGLRHSGDSRGPRLLDFRHRLAINTLSRWHRRGVDVEKHLPQLATYLGHVHVSDTYWYLSATPELLGQVLRRVERTERGRRS